MPITMSGLESTDKRRRPRETELGTLLFGFLKNLRPILGEP